MSRRAGAGSARRAGFRGIGGGAAPVTLASILGAGLTLLVDERPTMTGTTWTDQTGTGNHLVQSNATFKPTAGATINAQPTLLFDGSNDIMSTAGAISGVLDATGCTIFGVIRPKTVPVGADYRTDDQVFGCSTGHIGLTLADVARFWIFDSAYRFTAPIAWVADTVYAFRAKKDGVDLSLKVTGIAAVTGTAAGNIGNMTGIFDLAQTMSSGYGHVEVATMFTVNRATTAGEDAAVAAFLLAKYGVAIG